MPMDIAVQIRPPPAWLLGRETVKAILRHAALGALQETLVIEFRKLMKVERAGNSADV